MFVSRDIFDEDSDGEQPQMNNNGNHAGNNQGMGGIRLNDPSDDDDSDDGNQGPPVNLKKLVDSDSEDGDQVDIITNNRQASSITTNNNYNNQPSYEPPKREEKPAPKQVFNKPKTVQNQVNHQDDFLYGNTTSANTKTEKYYNDEEDFDQFDKPSQETAVQKKTNGNKMTAGNNNTRGKGMDRIRQNIQSAKEDNQPGILANNSMKGGIKDFDDDIDYDKLQQYNQPSGYYDPTLNSKGYNQNLPHLSKDAGVISYTAEEHGPDLNKGKSQADDQQAEIERRALEEQKKEELREAERQKQQELQRQAQQKREKEEEQARQAEEQKKQQETNKPKNATPDEDKSPQETKQPQQLSQNPVKEVKVLNIDFNQLVDVRAFFTSPCPKGIQIQCSVKRDRSGFNRFYPKYHLYFFYGPQYMMSAKKKGGTSPHYLISHKKDEIKKNSKFFIGKLRGNFNKSEYNIYDTGKNPKKTSNSSEYRENLGAILYESSSVGVKGPRKMRVMVPEVMQNGDIVKFKPSSKNDGIVGNVKNNRMDGIRVLENKKPKWNERNQAYVLDFNGRVEKPSVKNFQLVDPRDEDDVIMQFGKVTDDTFNLDLEWPLSPYQAFCIALTSFE